MNKLLVWDNQTGEINILQDGGVDDTVIDRYAEIGQRAGFFPDFKESSFDEVFVHRGRLEKRPPMFARIDKTRIKADGQDEAKIIGAPLGAAITVRHGITLLTGRCDGVIHFTAPLPGVWTIDIERHPYLPQRFQIIAE